MERICKNCGNIMEESEVVCNKCGTKYENLTDEKNVCIKCGHEIPAGAKFCMYCGASQDGSEKETQVDYIKRGFDNFTSTINTMAGEKGKVDIRIRELFSGVFKKHTIEERDDLFL